MNERKIKGKRSRQKAGIWWGLVTLTGMCSDMGRGVKKKPRSLFGVIPNQQRNPGGRPETDLPRPRPRPVHPTPPQPWLQCCATLLSRRSQRTTWLAQTGALRRTCGGIGSATSTCRSCARQCTGPDGGLRCTVPRGRPPG